MYTVTLPEQSRYSSTNVLAPCLGENRKSSPLLLGFPVPLFTCTPASRNANARSKTSKGLAPAKLGI